VVEGAVLGDSHGAGCGPHCLGRLFRAEPDRDPQDHHVALPRGEQVQQAVQPLGEFRGEQALLRAVVQDRAVGQIRPRLDAAAADGPKGVGDLVRGDAVDERPERQPLTV
jgi:hypothetical protein